MLILTRKPGESIFIGDAIKVTVVELKGNQIRIGVDAPKDLRIYREEIYLQILEENKQAATPTADQSGMESISAQWTAKTKSSSLNKLKAQSTPMKRDKKSDEGNSDE